MTSQSIDQVTDQQIADAARAVASLIEAKGKATGAFVDNMGRVCALEALKRVTVKLGVRNAVLRRLTYQNRLNIIEWNDTSTEAEVVKGFLRIADEAEARS
jgi:hypothetical protein